MPMLGLVIISTPLNDTAAKTCFMIVAQGI